jgi:S1-C subfamily serine protease
MSSHHWIKENAMKLIFAIILFLSIAIVPALSSAYCKNKGFYNECSNLGVASRIIESGGSENYFDYLAHPVTFLNERYGPSTRKEISDAKRFLKAAMPLAEKHPALAFYVASVIRKGIWAREGYRGGYGIKQHKLYEKQIGYFLKSLEMNDKWVRRYANRILGNIYYYGLLKPHANPYPYIVNVDYKRAAKFYLQCGSDCTRSYIASILKFNPNKGLKLIDDLNDYSEEKLTDENLLKVLPQNDLADFKYRYLWAIHKFGMFGIGKNERKAKKYHAAFSTENRASLLFGLNLKTGKSFFEMYRMFKKDTSINDKSAYPSFPESSKVELYLLHRSLEKKYTKAANWLSIKYSDGRGVRKDFLRSYAYINIALGFSTDGSKKREYERWLSQMKYKWKLTESQIIYAQQLSNKIMNKLKRSNEPKQERAKISSGTGFYISKEGHIITNQHVIDGCKTIKTNEGGSLRAISSVVEDVRNDVALLKGEGKKAIAFIRGGRGVRQGDEIIAYGYPLSGILSSSAKVTTGTVSSLSGLGDDFRYMQISAPVQPGNSGGPLLDQGGNVVGIVTAKINAMEIQKATGDIPQNVNFALKSSVIKDLLDANEINYETRAFSKKASTSDIVAEAKKYTVKIQCVK